MDLLRRTEALLAAHFAPIIFWEVNFWRLAAYRADVHLELVPV